MLYFLHSTLIEKDHPMAKSVPSPSPRTSFLLVIGILAMIAIPAGLTLHTAAVSPSVDRSISNLTPYGYTISLLLFVAPILAISAWFLPKEGVRISRKSFWRTIALLFPLGVVLDFFFAHSFFIFPNPNATLRVIAPALGGGVPVEEYLFYFTGFLAVLLIYIWLDEYWLAAYSIPVDAARRTGFDRLLRFHPQSLIVGFVLITGAIVFRHFVAGAPGFPGYFVFLVIGALGPSALLFPSALPVINWRAFGLTFFLVLLISLLWEATLALPYGWWGYRDAQMTGIYITAWSRLPIEAVCLWCAVTFATTLVYEVIRRWQSSGKPAPHAFLGHPSSS
jgi:hypothetical protein